MAAMALLLMIAVACKVTLQEALGSNASLGYLPYPSEQVALLITIMTFSFTVYAMQC